MASHGLSMLGNMWPHRNRRSMTNGHMNMKKPISSIVGSHDRPADWERKIIHTEDGKACIKATILRHMAFLHSRNITVHI